MTDPVVYRSRVRVERVHGFHANACPMYRSIKGSIAITTRLDLETSPGAG